MADTSTGVPSAAALITVSDKIATVVKNTYASIGLGLSTESTTLAAYLKALRGGILGDGSTSYGIGNAPLQAALKDPITRAVGIGRYDSLYNQLFSADILALDAAVSKNLPSGWSFTSSTQLSALDSYLLYLNAMNATAPATPAAAGTLTAATVAGGGLQTVAAGSAYYVVHCLQSASGDWYVSLPSAEATRVAISGPNNAYTYQIGGTVPAGVAYVVVFRGYAGGASGTWYLDSRTAVTAGASYPAITISQPDSALRTDWVPPSWASCLWVPESAAAFALAYASSAGSTGASMNPLAFTSGLQLTPNNVALTPSNGFLGVGLGNPSQSGIFGTDVVGTGYTAGAIATANNAATNTQGFAGAGGAANPLRARVTSVLDAAGTCAPTYSYYDAAHGWGSVQSATAGAVAFSGTGVGETAVFTITNGRIVIAVTAVANVTTTSGTYVLEAAPNVPRAI